MDFRILFSRLRPLMGLKIILFTACSRLLNPHANIFYGISAEDQVVQTLLKHPKTGYYVDVGCNHPIKFSNTFVLYMRGWKGLTIDADSRMIDLHMRIRPKDVSVCCALSDSEHEVVFTKFEDSSVSSVSPEFTMEMKNSVKVLGEERLQTRTLQSILCENAVPNDFDLLQIDVEGHDYEVLQGIDLNEYRPKLIMVEISKLQIENYTSNKICAYLKENGYDFIAYYNINGFFLRKDLIDIE